MEIRQIGKNTRQDIRLPNEPFPLFGQMIPTYANRQWHYEIRLFPQQEISQMCFPDEDYDYDAMCQNCTFLGAYEEDVCIGLAILQESWHKYLYLYDLKVCQAYRHTGVGTALMEAAKAVAKSKNYRGIYTVGQDNNLAACQFYLKTGFRIGGFDDHVYRGTSQEGKADIYFYWDF